MASNEHPDMSGNPMDAPFLCDHCGRTYKEEDAWGDNSRDDKFYCSEECALEAEDLRNELSNDLMNPKNEDA